MPKATYMQTNFTSGELSPRLEGRIDINKYANGLHKLENFVVYPHGGVTRRRGSEYVASSKDGDKKVRLVPFEPNVTQSYVLEFGENYIRFYRNRTQIDVLSELATTYTEEELFELQFVQSSDVLFIVHPNHPPARVSRTALETFTISDETFETPPFLDENITDKTLSVGGSSGNVTVVAAGGDVFESTDVGRYIMYGTSDSFTLLKITSYTTGSLVNADIIKNTPAINTPNTKWRLGAFSETTGYPSTVAFFEQRLMYAGTRSNPQTLWGSSSNIYNDFTVGAKDDNAVKYTIASDQVNAIRWLSSGKSLTIGTVGGEFLLSASSREEAITPSNIKIVRQSEYGGAYTMPIRANGLVLFAQRSSKKLRQFTYQFESDSYTAQDLTILSEHITQGGIVQMAYQRTPDSIVWVVRGDGSLLGMTYERDQDVIGWHRHTLGGVSDSNGTQAQVESIAVIPNEDEDELWLSVKRWVNGSEVRHIEVIRQRDSFEEDAEIFYVDSGIKYSGAATNVVAGLDHLEGETVHILGDRSVQAPKVVSGGQVTIDKEASLIDVGLGYSSNLATMRVEAGSADGPAQGKIKKISEVTLRLYNTLGVKVGVDFDNMDTISFRETSDKMDNSPPLFSGDKQIAFNGGYNTDGRVFVSQDQPLPMTLLAIISTVRTNN